MFVKREIQEFYNIMWLSKYLSGHKGFIAGGCFKDLFSDKKLKDIDMFFESEIEFTKAKMHFDGLCEGKNAEYRFYYENDNVIAYKEISSDIAIELIRKTYGKPEEVIGNFDFTITKFAMYAELVEDKDEDALIIDGEKTEHVEIRIVHHEKFFEHLHMKRTVVDDKLPFPVSTLERIIKYTKYGFYPCRETKVKIVDTINKAENLDNISDSLYEGFD